MNKKTDCRLIAGCRLQAADYRKKVLAAFTLFELLVSLALLALVITLLATTATQASTMWQELEEESIFMSEGATLMRLLDRDLRNTYSRVPITFLNQSDLFFLTRNANDDLVVVGYFLDPNKKDHCYRFVSTPQETLAAIEKGNLAELQAHASLRKTHSERITQHLISCEMTPIWNNDKKMILLEISMSFGKAKPCYFLSTVVALPVS